MDSLFPIYFEAHKTYKENTAPKNKFALGVSDNLFKNVLTIFILFIFYLFNLNVRKSQFISLVYIKINKINNNNGKFNRSFWTRF